eukprot:15352273-Ditylum_brightwellii.AAC.1
MELEDPKKAQQWRTVNIPEEILHYLTIQNRCYFGQAKGTPFTLPSLSQYFDWAANSSVSEMVLKDEFNSKELDEVQKLFIQHCKLEPFDKVISTKITKSQLKGKVAKWRENITTSSLDRHLGHFKALLRKIAESPDIDKGQEMFRKREDITDAH